MLKRIEYYCHHPLLQDGNVIIDMPGIDAPVKKDAELTYCKIEQLVWDSGVEEFRAAVTRYLTEEKRPQLFANLANVLQPLCISLRKRYLEVHRELESQPHKIEAMKAQELEQLSQNLRQIGEAFHHHIKAEVNQVVGNICPAFE